MESLGLNLCNKLMKSFIAAHSLGKYGGTGIIPSAALHEASREFVSQNIKAEK